MPKLSRKLGESEKTEIDHRDKMFIYRACNYLVILLAYSYTSMSWTRFITCVIVCVNMREASKKVAKCARGARSMREVCENRVCEQAPRRLRAPQALTDCLKHCKPYRAVQISSHGNTACADCQVEGSTTYHTGIPVSTRK
jgi:hypothetical protein